MLPLLAARAFAVTGAPALTLIQHFAFIPLAVIALLLATWLV
jgi:hypothetical protein